MRSRSPAIPRYDSGLTVLPFPIQPADSEGNLSDIASVNAHPLPDVDLRTRGHRQLVAVAVVENDGAYYAGVVLRNGRRPPLDSPHESFDSPVTIGTPAGVVVSGPPELGAHMTPALLARWEGQYRQVVVNRYQARRWAEQAAAAAVPPGLPSPAPAGVGYLVIQGVDDRGGVILGAPVTASGYVEAHAGTRGVMADRELNIAYATQHRRHGAIRFGYDRTTILYGHAFVVEQEAWVQRMGAMVEVTSTEPRRRLPRVSPDKFADLAALERLVAPRRPTEPTFAVLESYDSDRSPSAWRGALDSDEHLVRAAGQAAVDLDERRPGIVIDLLGRQTLTDTDAVALRRVQQDLEEGGGLSRPTILAVAIARAKYEERRAGLGNNCEPSQPVSHSETGLKKTEARDLELATTFVPSPTGDHDVRRNSGRDQL